MNEEEDPGNADESRLEIDEHLSDQGVAVLGEDQDVLPFLQALDCLVQGYEKPPALLVDRDSLDVLHE